VTFSIVAWDGDAPDGAEWGVAVASKFLAVGAVVPWARANVGALATQALANVTYGPDGLQALARPQPAGEVVTLLVDADEQREHRQLGIVDAAGESRSFTGTECLDWAGGVAGPGFAAQGNILTGPEVVDAMVEAFTGRRGDLASRLVAALLAGDRAGGDRRGRQSAALLVVREGGGYLGDTDVAIDLRVDDHADPVPELGRLLEINRMLFPRPSELEFVPLDDALAAEVRLLLAARGLLEPSPGEGYDDTVRQALSRFVGTENLELRWSEEAQIERLVLQALRTASNAEEAGR
jgi:uncharacterized Ntn-hydrolase superfamily protein